MTYNRRPLYTFNGYHLGNAPDAPLGHEARDVHGQNYIGYWTVLVTRREADHYEALRIGLLRVAVKDPTLWESNPRKIPAASRPDVSGSPALPCHGELGSSLPPRPVRFVA